MSDITLPEGSSFNRTRLLPLAMANHLCLGSIFAWSIFNKPLTRLHGVVAPSPHDWSLGDVSLTFSLVMGGFVWGALLSRRLEQWGPRASCLAGAACLGGGFALASAAVQSSSLPLLYAGGLVWGLSNGLAYVPPVAMLLKWYPDRKGFASGACLVGFGGGALVAAPLFQRLLDRFRTPPTYLGPADGASLLLQDGRLTSNGTEVVVATASDLSSWPGLKEGLYAVSTGTTGASETFLTLGAAYAACMALASIGYRLPPPSLTAPTSSSAPITSFSVRVSTATRTPQFALLWSGFGLSIMGSYGILAAGQTMLNETFGSTLPHVVTNAFAATFVASMSMANLAGRLFWSNASDAIAARSSGDPFWGRRMAFSIMWGAGPPLYLLVLWSIHTNAASPSVLSLAAFSAGVCGIISSFGGAAATWPAITGDLWGTKNVGILAARQLSVVLPAAFIGPRLVTALRERGIRNAIYDLAAAVPDATFEKAFGASKDHLETLIQSKAVTINRLLDLAGSAVTDPTPFLYDDMLMIMAGLHGASFVIIRLLKPVDKKHHE